MYLYSKLRFIPSQVVTVTVVLTLLLFLPHTWISWEAYYNFNSIIKTEFRLKILNEEITYFDEVLTMSASMNAATGDRIWEQRYHQFEPKLNVAIQESIQLVQKVYENDDFKKIYDVNQRLVAMEYQSFYLVKKGQSQAAQAILSSQEYKQKKRSYAEIVGKRDLTISHHLHIKVADYRNKLFWSIFASFFSLVMLIPAWLLVLRLLKEYLNARKFAQAALEKTNHELELRVATRTKELRRKNIQLQQTLQKLQQTQVQLIQTEKMSSLGQMMAGIAHEINNPITFVSGNLIYAEEYTQKLLKVVELYQQEYPNLSQVVQTEIDAMDLDYLKQDFNQLVKSMKMGTERIQEIVKSLQTFSRLDEAAVKTVDIHEGIDSTLMILHHRLKVTETHFEISVIKEYGLLPLIECNPGLLNQVFMNILANAIEALDEYNLQRTSDEIKANPNYIRIRTEVISKNWIGIQIIDNGPGIPEKIRSKLFDPFFTTKPVGKGIGLGLSISYQIIVDKHGGKLYCQSVPGQGAEFFIEIPISRS
ncbi:two-component sensor histidine kinase [Brasilonema octagenarum UFV-OR1]|uniref:histidine kinase n=1 Tax=Brasilonema octagenarum UFV-OR1 TaxID=417115 RepID=A0ABX1M9N8_9CYAN|nr:ATP-binding protein [Brasilonema octagenarum]NMF64510.1 two-component sensor histidine kinase [Brasilonema octagenarum UFV-OR1]